MDKELEFVDRLWISTPPKIGRLLLGKKCLEDLAFPGRVNAPFGHGRPFQKSFKPFQMFDFRVVLIRNVAHRCYT